jgi:folate-binding protein YgfZ
MVPHAAQRSTYAGSPVVVLRDTHLGEPGFELVVERERSDALRQALIASGCVGLDDEALESLRIEAGVPRFGRDMNEDTIPLEAGIEQEAISFSKGCYVGQEVIIRVLHRGHGRVARKLVGLQFPSDVSVPVAGTQLAIEDKRVGEVTSGAWSPALGRPIALGYVKRDFASPGTSLTTPDGVSVDVVSLPFRP